MTHGVDAILNFAAQVIVCRVPVHNAQVAQIELACLAVILTLHVFQTCVLHVFSKLVWLRDQLYLYILIILMHSESLDRGSFSG